jgi:hypothetical protein
MKTLSTAVAILFLPLIYVGGAWLMSRFFTLPDFKDMNIRETALIVLIPLGMSSFILCEHLFFPKRTLRYPEYHGRSIGMMIMLFGLLVFTLNHHTVPYWALLSFVFSYGALLYVLLSEMLLIGLARHLTKTRGENWPKELDYIYLALGAFGLANALNRMDAVTQNVVFPTFLSTTLLATALVVRLIKTRAEVNGWNKLDKLPENLFAEKPKDS